MDFLLSRRQITGLLAHAKNLVGRKYLKQILVGLATVALLAVGTVSYRAYISHKRQVAIELFKDCADLYKKALSSEQADQWLEVEAAAKAGLLKSGLTGLKPYFLMYQAQALHHQNKSTEAQALVKQALDGLLTSSPVYTLYAVTYALTLVDSNQAPVALELLKKLADNPKTTNRDLALFYLGEIYNRQGQADLAKLAFQTLVKDFKITEEVEFGFNQESAWVRPAEERLTYL